MTCRLAAAALLWLAVAADGARHRLREGASSTLRAELDAHAGALWNDGGVLDGDVQPMDSVLDKAGQTAHLLAQSLGEKIANSPDFLNEVGQVCDGKGDKKGYEGAKSQLDVDTSKLGIAPRMGRMNHSDSDYTRMSSFCKRECVSNKACTCFNIENATCNLQFGTPRLTKDTDAETFLRVVESNSQFLIRNATNPTQWLAATQNYVLVPNGKCFLGSNGQSKDSGIGPNSNYTGTKTVVTGNFTACKMACSREDCSCLDYVERKNAADPASSSNPFDCNLYFGQLGKEVFYDISNHDDLRSLTAIAVGPHSVIPGLYSPTGAIHHMNALEVFKKVAIMSVPFILGFIILYVCVGGPIQQLISEHYRKLRNEKKSYGELTTAEKRAHARESASRRDLTADERADVLMRLNPALFLRYRRNAQNFMQSPYQPYDFPCGGAVPYRREVEWKAVWWKRFWHFLSIKGTALRKCVNPALLVGSLAALWAWVETVYFSNPDNNAKNTAALEHFRKHMAGIAALHNHLITPATFVVMFSLNEALNRWQTTLSTMWSMQDPIQTVGFMLGSGFARAPMSARPFAFRFYRYLNVVHVLTYAPHAESLSTFELDDLVACNLLTATEASHLAREGLHRDGQRRRVLAWIWDILQDCVEQGVHKRNFGRIEKQLTAIREMGGSMGSEFGRDLPFSWAQCTELISLLVVGLAPFAFSHNMRVEGDQFQIWPALGSMVFAFFFFGMLEMIKTVTHAWDGKLDDFNPMSMLIETEQALFIAFTETMVIDNMKEVAMDNSDGSDAFVVGASKGKAGTAAADGLEAKAGDKAPEEKA